MVCLLMPSLAIGLGPLSASSELSGFVFARWANALANTTKEDGSANRGSALY